MKDNKKLIDQSFIKTIEEILKNNSNLSLVKHLGDYLLIDSKTKQHWTETINLEKFLLEKDNFSLYHTQTDYDDYRNNYIQIHLQHGLEDIFFLEWLNQLSSELHEEMFTVAGKIIPLSIRLQSIYNSQQLAENEKKQLFVSQFSAKRKSFVKIPANDEFYKVLEQLSFHIDSNIEKKQLLLTYCKNHHLLFNRIEAQTILNNFIHKYFIESNQYLEGINDFSRFLKDFSKDEDYFEPSFPVYFYKLNRKNLFKKLYNVQFTNKYQIVYLMEELVKFFNDKNILQKCHLTQVYLNDTETNSEFFSWTFHSSTVENIINYELLLRELIEKSSSYIKPDISTATNNNFDVFNTIFNHYLLSHSLHKRAQRLEQETIKKI